MERKLKHEYLNLARIRERKVIRGLFRGLKNNAICKEYGIPPSTLKQIISRLCARYDIVNNDGMRSETNRIKLVVRLYNAGFCPCAGCRSNRGRLRAYGAGTTSEHACNVEFESRERLEDSAMRKRAAAKAKNWKLSRDAFVPKALLMESSTRDAAIMLDNAGTKRGNGIL